MFRVILTGINLATTLTTTIASVALQQKLASIQKDLDSVKAQLDKVGIDLKSGAEFFTKIVDVSKDVSWRTAEIDVLTGKKIAPLVEQMTIDALALYNSLAEIPTGGSASPAGGSDLETALEWVTNAVAAVAIIWGGVTFLDGLKKWQASKLKASEPVLIEMRTITEHVENRATEVMKDVPVAKEPVELLNVREPATRMEKIGTAFDGIFIVLGAVGLVMNIIGFCDSEKKLEEQMDRMQAALSTAKENAAKITADEAAFFRDMPTTFLFMRAQLVQVSQIAAASMLVRVDQSSKDSKVNELITSANTWMTTNGFTDDEFTFMNQVSTDLDAIEKTQTGDAKVAAIQTKWKEVQAKIPDARFLNAFRTAPVLYTTLSNTLDAAFDNFNFVSDMVTAIQQVNSMVTYKMPLNQLGKIIAPVLHAQTLPDTVPLTIIALYTNYASDTYATEGDVKKIRQDHPTVKRDAWKSWVEQQKVANQQNPA